MALKKKPVTGMKDVMPAEMEIRDYLIGLIKDTYKTFGFQSMETPCVEHIENLCSKQGGDNEKLIFKILKRGEKLKIDEAKEENDLVDGGLRYDLTVPLARYYSNHANELPSPFKALQIGSVWRADRPQKGRFRQFVQCDIDILGEASNLAEIELILATTAMLGKLDFKNFTVCINDRNILKSMAAYSGFKEEDYDEVFIVLDKMDKIGPEGVEAELIEMGYTRESVKTYLSLFDEVASDVSGVRYLKEKLRDYLSDETADGLELIMSSVEAAKECDFKLQFTPTLVRGQSYYTGTIFEVTMDDFGGSVAGGGRYDKMIGKFTGQDTPACGFSTLISAVACCSSFFSSCCMDSWVGDILTSSDVSPFACGFRLSWVVSCVGTGARLSSGSSVAIGESSGSSAAFCASLVTATLCPSVCTTSSTF